MDFESIQVKDITKTLDYTKTGEKKDVERVLYDFIYTELLKIDKEMKRKDTQNYETETAYYCIRTNDKEGLAFGGIPKTIQEDASMPLFLILRTNKNDKTIKLDIYDNGKRPKEGKDGSISYDEKKWNGLNSYTEDNIAKRLIELLKEH